MCNIQFNLFVKSNFFSSEVTWEILCFNSSMEPFQNFFCSFSFFGPKKPSVFCGSFLFFGSSLFSIFSSVFTASFVSSFGSSFFISFFTEAFFSFFLVPLFSDFFSSFDSIVIVCSCLGISGSGSFITSVGKGNSSFIPRISFITSLFNLFKLRIILELNSILYSLFNNLK